MNTTGALALSNTVIAYDSEAPDLHHATQFKDAPPDLEDMLRALCGMGLVRCKTQTDTATLVHIDKLQGLKHHAGVMLASGERSAFRLFPPLGHSFGLQAGATEKRHSPFLMALGQDEQPIMEVAPADPASRFAFRAMRGPHGAERTDPARSHPPERASLFAARDMEANRSNWKLLGDSLDFNTIAEACGWVRPNPQHLRCLPQAVAVDHTLVSPFLEAVTDQAIPIRIVLGNPNLAHSLEGSFFDFGTDGTQIRMHGESAMLEVDTAAVASAWLRRKGGPEGRQTQLRLYDNKECNLLNITALPTSTGDEEPVWRTLIGALQY